MGAGPEEGRELALCYGVAEGLCCQPPSPLCLSHPEFPISPPPPHGSWPGPPLGCEQSLPYLQTSVICTPICGQMASWLAPGHPPPEGGPPLRPVSDSLGWSPRWGGSHSGGGPAWSHPMGLSTPEPRCSDIPLPAQEPRPGNRMSHQPCTHVVLQQAFPLSRWGN